MQNLLFFAIVLFFPLKQNGEVNDMSCFFPARILSWCSPLFGSIAGTQSLANEEVIAYEGNTVNIVIPDCPLAPGSVKIIPKSDIKNLSEWGTPQSLETYEMIQKIVGIWEQKGITDYLIYGKESDSSKSLFSWEIVPYPKDGWKFWKQFKVLWNITFGGSCLPVVEKQRIAKDFQKDIGEFSAKQVKQIEAIDAAAKGNDAFCNQEVIDKQLVFEGKKINVLYNYAPIVMGEGKLHFLIVPKRHLEKYTDLTAEEYTESVQLAQKLLNFYKAKGYHTAYIFDKSGAEAGQVVPHWHEHLVFTKTKTQDFFGKLTVLKNMLFGAWPLSKNELQNRVQDLRKELPDALKD